MFSSGQLQADMMMMIMTVKFSLRNFVELYGVGAFLVVATVDSGFHDLQWFGNSVGFSDRAGGVFSR